jgi:hypothetical protein
MLLAFLQIMLKIEKLKIIIPKIAKGRMTSNFSFNPIQNNSQSYPYNLVEFGIKIRQISQKRECWALESWEIDELIYL